MSFGAFFRGLVVYVVVVVCAALAGRAAARLRPPGEPTFVASRWINGQIVARTITRSADGSPLDQAGGALVFERVVGEGWLPTFSRDLESISILTAHDGVRGGDRDPRLGAAALQDGETAEHQEQDDENGSDPEGAAFAGRDRGGHWGGSGHTGKTH